MATLEHAIMLAAQVHAGQTDQAGQPYILHPLRVMLAVSGVEQQCAAVLHDVVEDTAITLADLRALGFAEPVLAAVLALTKQQGESRLAAAYRAAAHPIARMVKLADVTDNMNMSRIAQPTQKDWTRLEEYQQVKAVLLAAMDGHEQ
jgi:guanosine-3',5'-bis(diphosphate) 3'-pyrophosphohydrolase